MSRAMKIIQNPEVPGFECLLPPPPPPPPSSMSTNAGIEDTEESSFTTKMEISTDNGVLEDLASLINLPTDGVENLVGGRTTNEKKRDALEFQTTGIPAFPKTMQSSHFAEPAVEEPSKVEQPWWISTDADSVDFVPQNQTWLDQNSSWTDTSQKNISSNSEAKSKISKRKSEFIDPVQDAETVANAQKELSALMKPLKCDLCNAIMNSTLQAKLHYDGKPHQKKVSMFLNQSVKKLKVDDGQISSTTTNNVDWNTHCEVCKTWFTSQIDANQHYSGRKHIKATTGASKQKTKKPQASEAPVDPTGRFGIGVSFMTESLGMNVEAVEVPIVPPVASPVVSPINNYQNQNWPFPIFRCELCGVTANRFEQLETHKLGARHKKMLKMSGQLNPDIDKLNDTSMQSVPSSIDYSIYRTPSGQYYCAPCNRSFHTENSFAQHIESKKHKTSTINPKQAVPAVITSKKPTKTSLK